MSELNRRQLLHRAGWALLAPSLARGDDRVPDPAAGRPRILVGQMGTQDTHSAARIQALRNLDADFGVVGVVEPNPQRWAGLQATQPYRGLSRVSADELLDAPGVRGVVVDAPDGERFRWMVRCLAAGKHLYLNQPGGLSLAQHRQLAVVAQRRDVSVHMGYAFRHDAAFAFLRRTLREGWLGTAVEVSAAISEPASGATRGQLSQRSGGAMREIGCHLVDGLVAALGKPQSVTSHSVRTRPELDDLADDQLAIFRYPPATATIRCALLNMAGGSRCQFTIRGDQGTAEILPWDRITARSQQVALTLDRPRDRFFQGTQVVAIPARCAYTYDFRAWARVIRGEKSADHSPQHDLDVHSAVLVASGLSAV